MFHRIIPTLISVLLTLAAPSRGDNPIIKKPFTADPSALAYQGTVYLYAGNDEAEPKQTDYVLRKWLCFSSTDMVNWKPEGSPLAVSEFSWASGDAWACDVKERDGKFYFYAPVEHATIPGKSIGVAVSDSPTGPFKDARGSALITNDMTTDIESRWDDIDPCAFIDDDGQAYLFWGNSRCYYVKLKPNMIETDGPIHTVDLKAFTEAPWVHKRDGTYYLSYATEWPEKMAYATAESITGPWTYRGRFKEWAGNSNTNHHAIIDFKDRSYFIYHNGGLPGGGSYRRSVCVEELHYEPDGSIRRISETTEGVTAPPNVPPPPEEKKSQAGVRLQWLGGKAPATSPGVTWGVPWPRGTVPDQTAFTMNSDTGEPVPVQSWPTAFWPDGSLKWTAHAIGADTGLSDSLRLTPGQPGAPKHAVTVEESEGPGESQTLTIDTGVIRCRLAKSGKTIIQSITRDGKELAREGRLICLRQDQGGAPENGSLLTESFTGEISSVTIEQRGPVRAVVKIEGKHANGEGRSWLPFVVRLYFYAGGDAVRLMHTIIYDGDENRDFIQGLGVRFDVPMRGELYDRHVRFAGEEEGLWAEAVRGLTGLRRDPGEAVRQAQIAGVATPPIEEWDRRVSSRLELIPAFGDFTLFQPTADSFEIRKRTEEGFTWLNSAYGRRAAGLGFVGSPEGGVAFGIRDFWQSHPSQLDIRGAAGDQAEITMWLWSPEARAMDMRFYHDGMGQDTHEKQLEGLNITYEDYEPGFESPMGVARTSELMIQALPATPSRERTVELAELLRNPPLLVCAPADYKKAEVFGGAIWSLPDRSHPVKAAIEDQLDFYFEHYQREVEQRHWYGFWHYGDVMHSYDQDRHQWRYDVGGFGWANSELSPDLWLWYSYLRSGRADIFRMAEAMTRHTGEVDVHHLGRFAGLGSRHNVIHWGDSAKQLRISTAANRRFLYYLTADERTGDLMRELLDADRKLAEVPPGRKINRRDPAAPEKPFPMTMGVGTDWTSMAAAWLTEWERTGDATYRDKIVNGMKSIAALPHGWLSGGGGYDPETGTFFPDGDRISISHLSVVFGGFEINAELLQLLDVPEYEEAWLTYCRLYNASGEEQRDAVGRELGRFNLGQAHSRLTAYAAWKGKDRRLAERAWAEFMGAAAGPGLMQKPYPVEQLRGPAVLSPVSEVLLSTNGTSQFGLAAIQNLALVPEAIPARLPTEEREE